MQGPEVQGQEVRAPEVRGPEVRGPNWLATICPWGTNFGGPFVHGDRICWGSFVHGDQFFGDHLSMGTKFWGTICPWGLFVYGDRIRWGSFVHGDQFFGDHLSRGTESGGPEVWGSNGFGTNWVAAFFLRTGKYPTGFGYKLGIKAFIVCLINVLFNQTVENMNECFLNISWTKLAAETSFKYYSSHDLGISHVGFFNI